jgi:site-specific recombinase XerD
VSDLVAAFLSYAEHDRDRSPNTLRRYHTVLADLAATTGGDPATATRDQVEAWWQTRYGMEPATRRNELACLRAFYRWLTRFDHRADDPTRRLDPPKVPNRIPRPIGEADLTRLLEVAREQDPRFYRAIALGAYAGLRVGEAASLSWAHIDQDTRRIYVRGKGRKERVVGLSPVLLDKLLPETGGNIVCAGEAPFSEDTLARYMNRFIQRTLYTKPDGERPMPEEPATFHSLRKRFATLAVAKTGNVHAVANACGWASIETAATYAVASDETLDAIAAAVV